MRDTSVRRIRAFTLIELVLSVFLLTVGLIGLLAIFPVGADWTRKVTEESVSQVVARNALTAIQAHYNASTISKGGVYNTGAAAYTLHALPDLPTLVPLAERAYQYGAAQPFPSANPQGAVYFWTALARLSPDQPADGTGNRYDVYILVMKKGQAGDQYNSIAAPPVLQDCRAATGEDFVPAVMTDTYHRAQQNTTNRECIDGTRNTPQLGDWAIGQTSGTVFHNVMKTSIDSGSGKLMTFIVPQPQIKGTFGTPTYDAPSDTTKITPADNNVESILWVPPANPMNRQPTDSTPSPLVYVFQTTLSF